MGVVVQLAVKRSIRPRHVRVGYRRQRDQLPDHGWLVRQHLVSIRSNGCHVDRVLLGQPQPLRLPWCDVRLPGMLKRFACSGVHSFYSYVHEHDCTPSGRTAPLECMRVDVVFAELQSRSTGRGIIVRSCFSNPQSRLLIYGVPQLHDSATRIANVCALGFHPKSMDWKS